MKEANSFPTKITVSKQSNKVISSPWLCLPNPLLNFRLFLSPFLCLCLPQFLKKFVTTKSPFYRFGLSFTLPLSLSQKWNFRFCKFKKLECSPVTFCIFLLLSVGFSWLTQICILCFGPVPIYWPKQPDFVGTAGIFSSTK